MKQIDVGTEMKKNLQKCNKKKMNLEKTNFFNRLLTERNYNLFILKLNKLQHLNF